jgi:DNA primase
MEYFSNKKRSQSNYLLEFIKKKVDLAEFLETEVGCSLEWMKENEEARTICPMPQHQDTKPSFRIKLTEDNVWIFHCFGCGVKGTIIDFCMDYYDIHSVSESIWFICKKFGFKNDASVVSESLKDVQKKMNFNRKMECAHIVSANQCRTLLRKDYGKHSKWVSQAYRKMNEALDAEDIDAVEEIGFEASSKLRE